MARKISRFPAGKDKAGRNSLGTGEKPRMANGKGPR